MNEDNLKIFCWNIGNPSVERAGKQIEWLKKRPESLLILTETKNSEGCLLIEKYFKFIGRQVIFPKPDGQEYGVMIISKNALDNNTFLTDYIPSRAVGANLNVLNNKINIIGAYIPSRDISPEKIERKKHFLTNLSQKLKDDNKNNLRIFCGDLNILEPNHIPHYSIFQKWEYDFYNYLSDCNLIDAFRLLNPMAREYSWIGRTGDGYRYDHFFVSKELSSYVSKCYYDHEPRNIKLSDHAAIILEFGKLFN